LMIRLSNDLPRFGSIHSLELDWLGVHLRRLGRVCGCSCWRSHSCTAARRYKTILPIRMQRALRANKSETIEWLKFTLEGVGERTHGYAFEDTAF
jgi:hypothetical protein